MSKDPSEKLDPLTGVVSDPLEKNSLDHNVTLMSEPLGQEDPHFDPKKVFLDPISVYPLSHEEGQRR